MLLEAPPSRTPRFLLVRCIPHGALLLLFWACVKDVDFSGCLRLTDSRRTLAALRARGVAVQVWGTGIPDPG